MTSLTNTFPSLFLTANSFVRHLIDTYKQTIVSSGTARTPEANMTRVPIEVPNDLSTASSIQQTNSPAEAWCAIILAAAFLVIAFYQTFLCFRHRAVVGWSITLAALCSLRLFAIYTMLTYAVETLWLIEYAYHGVYPVSAVWLVAGALTHWLAPTLLTFYCIQVFGRAAWEALLSLPNRRHLPDLLGFIRWNTYVFGLAAFMAWSILCVGSIVVVAASPNGKVDESNAKIVEAGLSTLKGGLLMETIVLMILACIVGRFSVISAKWDVQWTEKRGLRWTWKRLILMVQVGLLVVQLRQIYQVVRFFTTATRYPWMVLIFDALPICGKLSSCLSSTAH